MSAPSVDSLTPETLIREVRHLPSAPRVLPRLKRLLVDGNSSMQEIGSLIRLDPGIAARVLQTANSPYFNHGRRCATVEEAVNRVGYDHVYELVSCAVASQVLVRPLESYGLEPDELWQQSVACALAADTLAARAGLDRDVAYTAGLLHCIGMVAIDEWSLHTGSRVVLLGQGLPHESTPAERAVFGFTHAEVGGALLQHWDFPRTIAGPVRHQYAPHACATDARMAGLLQVAKWVRSAACNRTGTALPLLPDPASLSLFGISASTLTAVAGETRQRLAEVTSHLQIPSADVIDRGRFPAQNWRAE